MRAYVITTGTLFALLVCVHIWRAFAEGPSLIEDPWYILITVTAAALTFWSWRVLRLVPKS